MGRGTWMIGLAILGCAQRPHVRLEAPQRQASAETRLAAYERLRAQPRAGYLGETFEDLRLGDGVRVFHPEDILPVVPPRSKAAQAARRSESLRSTSTLMLVGGTGLMVAGAAWIGVGVSDDAGQFLGSSAFGLAVATVGLGVVLAALSAIPEWAANDETSTAFVTYDRALRRRLDLCVSGFQMTSCR